MIGTGAAIITSAIIGAGTGIAQNKLNSKARKAENEDAIRAHNEELERAAREDAARIAANKPFRDHALRLLAKREARGGSLPEIEQFSFTQPVGITPSQTIAEKSLAAIGQRRVSRTASQAVTAGPSATPRRAPGGPVPPAQTSLASIGEALAAARRPQAPIRRAAPQPAMATGTLSDMGQPQTLASSGTPTPGFVRMRAPDGEVRQVPIGMEGYFAAKGAQRVA